MADDSALLARMLAVARPSKNEWVRAACSFCETDGVADKRFSWSYNLATGVWRCLRCQRWGRARQLSLGVRPELQAQVDKAKLSYDPTEATRPPRGFYLLEEEPARSSMTCRPAFDFLERRGVTAEKRRRDRIGACLEGRYFGRIITPILAEDGKTWLGWIGRSWVDKAQLRYLYPEGMPRGEVFYNHAAIKVKTDAPLFVCEGVYDGHFEEDGLPCLGKPSMEQLRLLLEVAVPNRPVVIILDADAAWEGWAHMMNLRLEYMMRGGDPNRFQALRPPSGLDPGNLHWPDVRAAARRLLVA